MPTSSLAGIRQVHLEVLQALDRLEESVESDVAGAVDWLLLFARTRLGPLMRDEEATVGPLLDQFIPAEAFSGALLRHEHDTIRGLLDALLEVRERLADSPPAQADARGLIADVILFLRDHIRREDDIIHPLLRLLSEPRARGHA